jgi:hypothetical protein
MVGEVAWVTGLPSRSEWRVQRVFFPKVWVLTDSCTWGFLFTLFIKAIVGMDPLRGPHMTLNKNSIIIIKILNPLPSVCKGIKIPTFPNSSFESNLPSSYLVLPSHLTHISTFGPTLENRAHSQVLRIHFVSPATLPSHQSYSYHLSAAVCYLHAPAQSRPGSN